MSIHAHFVGNVGKDAKFFPSKDGGVNGNVCLFSVGTRNYNFKDKKEDTLWVSCRLYGKTAEKMSTYLTKGKQVAVTKARMELEDREHEGKRYVSLACVVDPIDGIELIGKKDDHASPSPNPAPTPVAQDEDVPF